MKSKHFLMPAVLAAAVVFQGCLEHETTTQVNRDGTLLRAETLIGDSSEVYQGNFPAWVDSTWKIDVQVLEPRKYVRSATKVFRDAAEMNRALHGEEGLSMNIRADLRERFLWFFTEYRYSEIYPRFSLLKAVPLTDYVSPAVIDIFRRHEVQKQPFATKGDSLTLKAVDVQFNEWFNRCLFEGYFAVFIDGVRSLNDSVFTASSVATQKEKLFDESGELLRRHSLDSVQNVFEQRLGKSSVRKAMALNAKAIAEFKRKVEFLDNPYSPRASFLMPGLIIDTNAPTVEGNKVSWKDFLSMCYVEDFELWAVSRVVNWWAIVLTGALVLGSALLYIVGILRRRRYA